MTITQMRYVDAVYRYGNVTNAAKMLYVSQPSISNAIRELERELGIRLFYRTKMRLVPTEEGEYFAKECARVLKNVESMAKHTIEIGSQHKLIRLGIPPTIGTLIFSEIFLNFLKENPDVQIEAVEHGAFTLQKMITEESIDMAIIAANKTELERFEVFPIVDMELQFCIGMESPLAEKDCVSVEDIRDIPVVLQPEGAFTRQQAIDWYTQSGCEPKVLLQSGQIYTVERLIKRGDMGTFLLRDIVKDNPDIKGLSVLPPMEPVHVGVVWKKDRHLYGDAINLLNFIQNLYKK